MNAVGKYLARWATPEAALAGGLGGGYAHAVVVPVHDEPPAFLDGIAPVAGAARALVVCVVNATDAAPARAHAANAETIAALTLGGRPIPGTAAVPTGAAAAVPARAWLARRHGADVLVIDRASPGARLPDGEGVGLARRIGCDVALAARARGQLASRWIHTTDADAVLPASYFSAAGEAAPDAAALVYPFVHRLPDGPEGEALALYELSLRYYVAGLAGAGSPQAFHTVGSTLAVDAEAYAAARGVPRRQAAEDFYLLNKVAKLGRVVAPQCAPIEIAGRVSDRVPFGTGPATRRIADDLRAGRPVWMYDPRGFALLGMWLEALAAVAGGALAPAEAGRRALDRAGARLGDAGPLAAWLARPDVQRALAGAATERGDRRARRLREWFDAFRTRVFVHAVRDAGLAPLPWRDAVARAAFMGRVSSLVRSGADAIAVCRAAREREADPLSYNDGAPAARPAS